MPNACREVSGAVPEWPLNSVFMRKSSRRANATYYSVFRPAEFLLKLLCDSSLNFLRNLSYIVFLRSENTRGLSLNALGCSSHFSLCTAAKFFSFQRVAISTGKVFFTDKKVIVFSEE